MGDEHRPNSSATSACAWIASEASESLAALSPEGEKGEVRHDRRGDQEKGGVMYRVEWRSVFGDWIDLRRFVFLCSAKRAVARRIMSSRYARAWRIVVEKGGKERVLMTVERKCDRG
jgi:hypothetical protein